MTEEDRITRYGYCPECGGLGNHVDAGTRGDECGHCDGYGVVPCDEEDHPNSGYDLGGEG